MYSLKWRIVQRIFIEIIFNRNLMWIIQGAVAPKLYILIVIVKIEYIFTTLWAHVWHIFISKRWKGRIVSWILSKRVWFENEFQHYKELWYNTVQKSMKFVEPKKVKRNSLKIKLDKIESVACLNVFLGSRVPWAKCNKRTRYVCTHMHRINSSRFTKTGTQVNVC